MSKLPPLCRYCGGAIAKRTRTIWFGRAINRVGRSDERTERPKTKDEAQRLLNKVIVSVRYWGEGDDRHIHQVTVWDSEADGWKSEFFCNGDHAQRFGYAAARGGYATDAYKSAIAARKEKADEQAQT